MIHDFPLFFNRIVTKSLNSQDFCATMPFVIWEENRRKILVFMLDMYCAFVYNPPVRQKPPASHPPALPGRLMAIV